MEAGLVKEEKLLGGEKRELRGVSFALCSAVLGVLLMRIVLYLLPAVSTYGESLATDALFSLTVQIVFFLGVPFIVYSLYGKRRPREVLEYSSCGRFEPYFLLAIPLGVCVYAITIGVSSAWQAFLGATGYKYVSGTPDMPETFNAGFLAAELFMTALLPAVCEEFCMRGGLLTSARKVFGTAGCVVFCGVAFGLFHQNVRQVFYTALFGALAAFLVLKTKSIYPAMLMHFTNNFLSVISDYALNYDWAIGELYGLADSAAVEAPWLLFILFAAVIGAAFGLVVIILYCRERKVIAKKMAVIRDSAFDVTNKRVVIMGEFDEQKIEQAEMQREVYGADYRESKYRPTARDVMIIVGLGVVTVLTTVFTYVWGFFY